MHSLLQKLFRKRLANKSAGEESTASTTAVTAPSISITDSPSKKLDNFIPPTEIQKLPLLYNLARQWAWPAVLHRCHTHPDEASASFVDIEGATCLHWVCFGCPPANVVEALLKVAPELARIKNNAGCLPLHVACSYRASADVIRALVCVYPNGAGEPSQKGSYPLHLLCDYGNSFDAFLAVLQSDYGVKSIDRQDGIFGRKPLFILNERKNLNEFHHDVLTLRHEANRKFLRQRNQDNWNAGPFAWDNHTDIDEYTENIESDQDTTTTPPLYSLDFWQKASLLVLTEYTNRTPSTSQACGLSHQIVHACAGLDDCPLSILEFSMLLNHDQLLEIDAAGQTPLHIACLRQDNTRLLDILSECPKAARIRDSKGFFPLELVIQVGKQCRGGIAPLVVANPVALEVLDLDDRLYPHIWFTLQQHPGGLSALFESMKNKPNLINMALN